MKTVIDNMTSATGWSVTGTGTVAADTWPDLAADYLSGQLKVTLSTGAILTKTFASVSIPYGNISFSIMQRPTVGTWPIGYWLTIKLTSGVNTKQYYIPNTTAFDFVSFYNPFTTLDKVEFIAQTGLSFFVSNLICYSDRFPYDLYQAVSAQITRNITATDKLSVGTITGTAGASTAILANAPSYVDKYSVISFGAEMHKISEIQNVAGGGVQVRFTSDYSGTTLVGSPAAQSVSLEIPVVIENDQFDATIPAIGITDSFVPERAEEFENFSPLNDSISTDGFVRTRNTGTTWLYTVNIRGSARTAQSLETLSKILRKSFNSSTNIWINGRRHEALLDSFEFVDYDGATDILPQINVIIKVYITEETWQEEIQTQALTWTTTVSLP